MSNLQLVTSREFNGITLNCYQETGQADPTDFWATREQIGQALGYATPGISIGKIHERHKDRLDKFSRVSQIDLPFGGTQSVVLYNFKGLLEICRYSQQEAADAVMDVLWDIADEIRRTGQYSVKPQGFLKDNIEAAKVILDIAHIEDNQLVLALDKVYKKCAGFSMLEATGLVLEAPTKHHLITPTDIGKEFGMSARRVNQILAGAGWQHKIANKWEPLELGEPYAVMQEMGKAHSDGTPIRQLKWDSSILDVFGELMEGESA